MSKKVTRNYNSIIIDLLGVKPVAFNPMLGRIAGSATAGLFMSQLLFWWCKGTNPNWIYKTIEEMKNETCLTRSEQEVAIKKWKRLAVLKTKRAGIPAKRNFNIDLDKLVTLLKQNDCLSLQKTANCFAETGQADCNATQTTTESDQRLQTRNIDYNLHV